MTQVQHSFEDHSRFDRKHKNFTSLYMSFFFFFFFSVSHPQTSICSTQHAHNRLHQNQNRSHNQNQNQNFSTPKGRRVRRLEDEKDEHKDQESEHDDEEDERLGARRARRRLHLGEDEVVEGNDSWGTRMELRGTPWERGNVHEMKSILKSRKLKSLWN